MGLLMADLFPSKQTTAKPPKKPTIAKAAAEQKGDAPRTERAA